MPELAEAIFYKNKWSNHWQPSELVGSVFINGKSRVFRDFEGSVKNSIWDVLHSKKIVHSFTLGKQIYFVFANRTSNQLFTTKEQLIADRLEPSIFLGIHLGMTGRLSVKSVNYAALKKDALILYTNQAAYVFSDTRQFGKVKLFSLKEMETILQHAPTDLLSDDFDQNHLKGILCKKSQSLIKSALLDQKCFPGIGNYLADEILFYARISPHRKCLELKDQSGELLQAIKLIASEAIRIVAEVGGARDEMSSDFPSGWLFNQRWGAGGVCPTSGNALVKEKIGGRSTVWSPSLQK